MDGANAVGDVVKTIASCMNGVVDWAVILVGKLTVVGKVFI
jgi:hypothetical protein